MGFLKNIYFIFLSLFLLLFGCSESLIQYKLPSGKPDYKMFGENPGRSFYVPYTFGDSLKLEWESEINGSFPNSSVTCYDSLIFVNDLSGRVFAFYIKNGKEVGELKYSGAVYSSPLLYKHNVIFAVASKDKDKSNLIYYDFSNGNLVFDKVVKGRVLTEMLEVNDGIILNTDIGIVYKYGFNGKKVWEYNGEKYVHSSPAFSNNIVAFGNDDGEVVALNAKNGKLIYSKKMNTPFFGGTSISANTIFIGNDSGEIYSINLENGKKNWSYPTGARILMTPAVNKDAVVIGNLDGNLYSLDKKTGKLNWKTSTDGVLNATPLLSKNLVFVPDFNEKLHLVNIQNGNIEKTLEFDGRTKLSPVYYFNLLFVGYDNGILRAYEILD